MIYVTVGNGKLWIEYDGMDSGIVEDLIGGGIADERIVLAYLSEEQVMVTV